MIAFQVVVLRELLDGLLLLAVQPAINPVICNSSLRLDRIVPRGGDGG